MSPRLDFDLCLSLPGPLHRTQLWCRLRRWCPYLGMSIKACYAEAGESCSQGDDKETCPHAVWLELDCSGPDADCEGLPIEALPEDAGTELEGVAQLLSDVWSFVDGDGDRDPYDWETIRAGRSAHERAHVEWCRESAARFMARATITTGDCDPDPGLEAFARLGDGRAALARA